MKIYLPLFIVSLGMITVILPSTAQWHDQQQCQSKCQEVLKNYYLSEQVLARFTELADVGLVPEVQVKSNREYRDRLLKQLRSTTHLPNQDKNNNSTILIQSNCEIKIGTALTQYHEVITQIAIFSTNLTDKNPRLIALEKKRAKLEVVLEQEIQNCPPLKFFNTLIIPGQRFGIITAKTTYQDLVKHFGKNRLRTKEFWWAEDEVKLSSTDVDLGLDLSFTIVWKDNRRNAPSQVFTSGSKWHTAEEIHVGLSFSQLQKILGEFQISGMEWDYGNQVIIDQSRWKKHFDRFFISIAVGQDTLNKFPKDYEAVLGEQSIASSSTHWEKLKPYISKLTFYF